MRLLKFILIFTGILLVSAFLAPLIYQCTSFKFERILSRLVTVFSLVTVFLFVRKRSENLGKYGLLWNEHSFAFITRGFLIGFITLGLLTAVEIILGGRQFSNNWDPAWKVGVQIVQYLCISLFVGFLEEFFFRGFIFGQLKANFSTFVGLLGTNLVYASLHFFKGGGYVVPDHPNFIDSFKVMVHLADPFFHAARLWPSFLGLLFFGTILSFGFLRTGSLFLSIGIHAGCVFFLKVDNWFVVSVPTASTLLFGDKNLYSGLFGWFFLGLLYLFLNRAYPNKSISL